MKLHIQELKLQAEEDPSEVKKWRLTINEKQKMLEPSYQRLQKVMQKFEDEEANIKEQERKQECDILRSKRLCFNCTRAGHRASDCTSKGTCKNCKAKHHTSICEKERNQERRELLISTVEQGVIYPIVVVKVNGIACRALLDAGSGSSYISTKLADLMSKKPVRVEHRKVDTKISTTTRKVEVFQVKLQSLNEHFSIEVEAGRVDRGELLTTSNPKYQEIIHKYSHLHGVEMLYKGEKNELPVHMILGASMYFRIKTPTKPRIGKPGDPIAELTKLGWVIMSPGHEADLSNMFLPSHQALI